MFFPVLFEKFFKNTFFHRTLPVVAPVLLAFAVHKVLEFGAVGAEDDLYGFLAKMSWFIKWVALFFLLHLGKLLLKR